MYLDRFRLTRAPFGICADVEQFYGGNGQQRALDGLTKALSNGADTLALVIAPSGCGKSTLIDKMLADLGEASRWSRVSGFWDDPVEFLRAVVFGFGFDQCSASHDELRSILQVFLTYHGQRGQVPLLVVENAHDLEAAALEELHWLAGLRVNSSAALRIVLSGPHVLKSMVGEPAMAWLDGRQHHLVEVSALSSEDTHGYILHRLGSASAMDPGSLFDADAAEAVYRYTGGIPGLINTLCETALSCAAQAGESQVTADIVDVAAGKLRRVSESGKTRVQGMRSSDAKIRDDNDLGQLVVTCDENPVRDYRITKERVLIGREIDSDLHLNGAGVSRYHALLLLDSNGWLLIDLQSLNGTYVNAERIRQQRLANGDAIFISDFCIRVQHKFKPAPVQPNDGDGKTMVVAAAEVQAMVEAEQQTADANDTDTGSNSVIELSQLLKQRKGRPNRAKSS